MAPEQPFRHEREDLAAAFQMAAKLNFHEAVANHFSLAVSDDGKQFLINPNQRHFSLIRASDILLLDADDPTTLDKPDAPDKTAWGLHGAIHRHVPHATCIMHVHSTYATVLASLKDPRLPPLEQNSAMFFERFAIDMNYGGLAFEAEGERCAKLLDNPQHQVLIMGNHGVLVIGNSVADAFNRLYYFERAAKTYILALQTGQPLNILSDEIARLTASQLSEYPEQGDRHFADIKRILELEGSNFRA